jgi:hypothetical protein
MFLSATDLQRLTGKVRFSAQRRALDRLGVSYTLAATGEPLVRREALDGTLGKGLNAGPKWNRIAA